MKRGQERARAEKREVLFKVNNEVYGRDRSQTVPGESGIQMFPLREAEVNLWKAKRLSGCRI